MIYFDSHLSDDELCFQLEEGEERKSFRINRTNDINSLPTITPGFSMGITEDYYMFNKIIIQGTLTSPIGDIDVSNGFFIYFNGVLIPIVKETLLSRDEFLKTAIAMNQAGHCTEDKRYLDYYYIRLKIDKLKELKSIIKGDKLIFFGFDDSDNMSFGYEINGVYKKFTVSQLCGTMYNYVYFPLIKFEKTISIEEIKIIVNYLIENKKFDFGEEIGQISFEQIIIEHGESKFIPVTKNTKDKIDKLYDMSDKEYKNRNNNVRWLKR